MLKIKTRRKRKQERQNIKFRYSEKSRGQQINGRDGRNWGKKRLGKILVLILRLVLRVLNRWMIISFRLIVGLRPRVPRPRIIELIYLNHIFLLDFMVSCTMGFMIRGEINVLDVANLVIFRASIR